LLTNHPPAEARERFLQPGALVSPRQYNPELLLRTERAVLWAMNLHPDERPQNIEEFRQALVGNLNPVTQPRGPLPRWTLGDILANPTEKILAIISASLLLLTLIITLMR
jgi:serine/threonine-protein kinase